MFGLLVFAVLFICGAWFLSGIGPGRSGANNRKSSGQQVRLESDIETLRTVRMEIRSWPSQDIAEMTSDQEKVLRSALRSVDSVATRKNLMTNEELLASEELETLASELLVSHLIALSERLEAEGDTYLEQANSERGMLALESALEKQVEVNTSFPDSLQVNRKRAFFLERKIKKQQSEPLHQKSIGAEEAGELALGDGNWQTAHLHFQEAFAKQVEINEQHSESKHRDPLRLQALQTKMAHAQAYESILTLNNQFAKGLSQSQQLQYLEAAHTYRNAIDKINLLIKEKPDLGPLLLPRAKEATIAVTDSAVMHFQNYFIEQFAQLDRHLVEGQINMALELEEKLRVKLKDVERQYPDVLPHLADEQVRTNFLQGRKDRLAAQQKYLRHQFAPVPGHANWWMLRSEVSQELYTALMDVPSPSRSRGGNLPVESVSHADAEAFALRVSWLLGVPSQLPSREHFFAAAGKPTSLAEVLVQSKTSTVPVTGATAGPGGFFHLWGNVSEWLANPDGNSSNEVSHAGGHFLDTATSLAKNSVRQTHHNDRNRLIGFRVVIQISQP